MDQATGIIKTLAFFDLFGIPLTAAEVYSHAGPDAGSLAQTDETLHELVKQGKLKRAEAFYLLPDRSDDMVSAYKLRQARAFEMLRDAKPWLSRLAAWPDVQGLAICNSLAFLNAHANSDIDVFVQVKPGALWTTRFVLVSLLHLLNKRPTTSAQAGKMCLSFFMNADKPSMSNLAISDDIYLRYWTKTLMPVYDVGSIFPRFQEENRTFTQPISRDLPQTARLQKPSKAFHRLFAIIAPLIRRFQDNIKRAQLRRFPSEIVEQAGRGTSVIISNDVLKFHTQDRRAEYRDAWIKRYQPFL